MTERQPRDGYAARLDPLRFASAVIAGLIAVTVVAVFIKASGPTMNDPDSAASVLFWDHLIGGRRLVTFVSTTPKPILTVLNGISVGLTDDWRVSGWLTLLAFGVLAASEARFVSRFGAPWAAALVATLVASPAIVLEVSRANWLIWGAVPDIGTMAGSHEALADMGRWRR